MAKAKSLIIVQPYLPRYWMVFFSRLIDILKDSNIRCRVVAAAPSDRETDRGDATSANWLIPVRHHPLHVGGRTLTLGGASKSWAGADGVIMGHLGSSVDTFKAILDSKRPRSRLRVGVSGHIDYYVADSHPIDAAAERWQLRQADHVFAYSASGAAFAATLGAPAERLTTVMNTVGTQILSEFRQGLTDSAIEEYMTCHGLKQGRTLGFFGGLDESKRISFLAEALDRLWATDPDLRVVVGGKGSQSNLLGVSISKGQTIRLGYATPYERPLWGG